MKSLVSILSLMMFVLMTCTPPSESTPENTLWKYLPNQIITRAEAQAEIAEKMVRLQAFLEREKLNGMLFTQVRDFYWITAGLASNQIVLNKDVGAASALIMKDGSKYLLCNDSEASRLMNEIMTELGYTLKRYDWFESNILKDVRGDIISQIAAVARIGSDVPYPNTVLVADQFKPLRYSLTEPEIKRYRWLGQQTTQAVESVCRSLKTGMDEFEIEALTAAELRSRGIMPTVLLIGVDDRIYQYRHCLPAGAKLQNYAMVNVVAEKWGMPMAVTRFVHFGPLPEELKTKLEKTALINAKYQKATVPGKSCAEIFEECKTWYAEAGYEGEWMKHHQGGATGYDDREYVIYPGVKEVVQERQAFAWNPTITGAKIEDTIITYNDHFEVVTDTGKWPTIEIQLDGKIYPQPAILVMEVK